MCANLEDKRHHTFTWKIENFSSCTQKKGVFLRSPMFTAESLDETTWYLQLYPRGRPLATNGYISFFLERNVDDRGALEIECCYRVEITRADKQSMLAAAASNHKYKKGGTWGWTDFMESKVLFNAGVSEDTLIIKCYLMGSIPKMTLVSENVGLTKIGIDHCSFMWTVKNLNSSCTEVMKFPCSGTSQIEITVKVHEDDIKIDVRRAEGVSGSQSVKCKIALLDVKGEEQDSRQTEHLFETTDFSAQDKNDTWELPTFIKKSQLNSEESKYLKDDSFTLLCEVSISNGTTSETILANKCDSSLGETTAFSIDDTAAVVKDLKRMYFSKIQTDVKLHVENQDFSAHKSILSSRSPVFLAMFDKDMTESQTGSVDILDLEAKTIELLLEYMYTGTVEHFDCDMAMKLMVAADKYQVLSLKEKCAEFLASILTNARVCDILVIADLVEHDLLKASAISYIKEHSKNILLSEKWKRCVEKNLKLATETVCQISTLLATESNNGSSD